MNQKPYTVVGQTILFKGEEKYIVTSPAANIICDRLNYAYNQGLNDAAEIYGILPEGL